MSIEQKLISLGLAFESVNINYEPVIIINNDKSIKYLIEQLEQQQTTINQQQILINSLITNVKALCTKDNLPYL
jgi:hypothetical protein